MIKIVALNLECGVMILVQTILDIEVGPIHARLQEGRTWVENGPVFESYNDLWFQNGMDLIFIISLTFSSGNFS